MTTTTKKTAEIINAITDAVVEQVKASGVEAIGLDDETTTEEDVMLVVALLDKIANKINR